MPNSASSALRIEAVSEPGGGQIGFYAAMSEKSLLEVLRMAANHDGESDSTASIAGQLYGAANGLANLPNAWVRRLDVLDTLFGLVRKLEN